MRLPVSLCHTSDAVVMAPGVKHANPGMGRGVMRVAMESRLPNGERTSTASVAHQITDDTGGATTGDLHVVRTVVLPTPSNMVMNCRLLGWNRTTSCDHRVVAPIDITVGSTDQGPLTPHRMENKALLHDTAWRTRPSYTTPHGEQGPLTPRRMENKALLHDTAWRTRPSYTTPHGEQGPLTPHRMENKALLHHTAWRTRPSYTTPHGEQGPLTRHRMENKALLHDTAWRTRPSYTTPHGEQGPLTRHRMENKVVTMMGSATGL